MEYTVQKLGQLAGVSSRTLRYYDEIGLLKPGRINDSGYRIYGQEEVNLLQQILFYREIGISLEGIRDIIDDPNFDISKALIEHREKLITKKEQLDRLIATVEKTIAATEGRIDMSDKERFEGFKKKLVQENEAKYGKEIRGQYGDDTIERSNERVLNMSEDDYEAVTQLEKELNAMLKEAFAGGDPGSEIAQKAVDTHRQWLSYYWDQYTKEYHVGLGEMYVGDERFKAHYDAIEPGVAQFLRDAIYIYTGMQKG